MIGHDHERVKLDSRCSCGAVALARENLATYSGDGETTSELVPR